MPFRRKGRKAILGVEMAVFNSFSKICLLPKAFLPSGQKVEKVENHQIILTDHFGRPKHLTGIRRFSTF